MWHEYKIYHPKWGESERSSIYVVSENKAFIGLSEKTLIHDNSMQKPLLT